MVVNRKAVLWITLCVLVGSMSLLAAQEKGGAEADTQATLEKGRACTTSFYKGELEGLVAKFSPEMKQTVSLEMLTTMQRQIVEELGGEAKVLSEEAQPRDEYMVYRRIIRLNKSDASFEVLWLFREEAIAGFLIRDQRAAAPTAP